MSDNILLISEDESNLEFLLTNVSMIRRDKIAGVVSLANLKRAISPKTKLVLINEKEYSHDEIIKTISMLKRMAPDCQILVILEKNDEKFINECYQNGVHDFINSETCIKEYNIRLLNSLKFIALKEEFEILSVFLRNSASVNSKTGLYSHKALKEAYYYLKELPNFQTGSYIILTIDTAVRTKVSMNRLAQTLKKYLRQTDVIAQGIGKYYLYLPETDFAGAKNVIEKIADIMGNDIKIHAGISIIGIQDIDELEKDANDSLKSATAKDELYVCLGENVNLDDNTNTELKINKHFKLFQKIFEKKLSDIIEPVFFRMEKEFQSKSENFIISQYANKVESVFCIKNKTKHSELVMRYDGFAKFNLKIIHQGLDTCENTLAEINLNELTDKLLIKYLNLLYNEFKQS